MVTLISTKNCAKCKMVKLQFDAFNIKYLDVLFEDLETDIQDEIINTAKTKGKASFPIILKQGEIIDVEKIIGRRI